VETEQMALSMDDEISSSESSSESEEDKDLKNENQFSKSLNSL